MLWRSIFVVWNSHAGGSDPARREVLDLARGQILVVLRLSPVVLLFAPVLVAGLG